LYIANVFYCSTLKPQPNDHFHRILRGLTAWPFKKSSQEIDQSKFTSIGNTLGRQLDVLGHYSKQKDNNYFTSLENNDNLKTLIGLGERAVKI